MKRESSKLSWISPPSTHSSLQRYAPCAFACCSKLTSLCTLQIKFITKIYHPNVKSDGGFCTPILAEEWSPQLKIADGLALFSFISILLLHFNYIVLKEVDKVMKEPNPDNPLEPEIAQLFKSDKKTFLKNAQEWTKKHAK